MKSDLLQAEDTSPARSGKSGYDARRQRYEQTEKGKARRDRAKAKRQAVASYTPHIRINLLSSRYARALCLRVSEPAGRVMPIPAVAARAETTDWKRLAEEAARVIAFPEQRLPYFAGKTLDLAEIERLKECKP